MIEQLESRLLCYVDISNPNAVIAAGNAIVGESPSLVVQTAGDGIAGKLAGPISPLDPAMAEVIAAHEGYVPHVYLDVKGNATVGYGLLLSRGNRDIADPALSSVGLTMAKVLAKAKQSPGASILTPDQAWTVLLYAVYLKFNAAAHAYGPEFYRLDRDPQIAIVDMTYRGDVSLALRADIKGDLGNNNATDYSRASDDVVSSPTARQQDDAILMANGKYPTNLTLDAININVGDSAIANDHALGSKGKPIVLSADDVQFSTDSPDVATVADDGTVTGLSAGVTALVESVSGTSVTATASVTVGSASGVFNIPPDGNPVTLAGVKAGQTIAIRAGFSTSDPNENGEGEPLSLSSSGGFSAVDDSYNATNVYTFTASVDDETVTATPNGWDGDEGASIFAKITNQSAAFSPAQRQALSSVANATATSDAGASAAVNGFASAFGSSAGITSAAGISAALLGLESDALAKLAIDPADSNYSKIAKPAKTNTAILLTAKEFSGVSNAKVLASAINAVVVLQQKIAFLGIAAYTTANRIDGAQTAQNRKWVTRQTAILRTYKKQIAALLAATPKLLVREVVQLNAAGFGQLSVAASDVHDLETSAANGDVPTAISTTLQELGISTTMQKQIRQSLLAQDTTLASGNYATILKNTVLDTALLAASAQLKR